MDNGSFAQCFSTESNHKAVMVIFLNFLSLLMPLYIVSPSCLLQYIVSLSLLCLLVTK